MFECEEFNMGHASGGGYSSPGGLSQNLGKLLNKFPSDRQGRLGAKGRNKARLIASDNPAKTSEDVYSALKSGGKESRLPNGKGRLTAFPDGSRVIHRPVSSSDGSPVVEISIKGPNGSSYKIHFIPKESK
jgi:hypothetical protein